VPGDVEIDAGQGGEPSEQGDGGAKVDDWFHGRRLRTVPECEVQGDSGRRCDHAGGALAPADSVVPIPSAAASE